MEPNEVRLRITNPDHPEDEAVECTLAEFAEANADTPEVVELAQALRPGGSYTDGGGAQAFYRVERIGGAA